MHFCYALFFILLKERAEFYIPALFFMPSFHVFTFNLYNARATRLYRRYREAHTNPSFFSFVQHKSQTLP